MLYGMLNGLPAPDRRALLESRLREHGCGGYLAP
jgi:hypothetical protein